MAANSEIANRLQNAPIHEKRKILLDHRAVVQIQKEQVIISFKPQVEAERSEICIDAKLAKQGIELIFTISPTNVNIKPAPNATLQKLVAQAFAAQDLLLTGKPNPALSNYSHRYLGQLVHISWLAPDIIGAIMDGTQPVDLTGRKFTRATLSRSIGRVRGKCSGSPELSAQNLNLHLTATKWLFETMGHIGAVPPPTKGL